METAMAFIMIYLYILAIMFFIDTISKGP